MFSDCNPCNIVPTIQVAVETMIKVGDPKEMICQAAEESKVDLLIVGSHSRGPVQRYSLKYRGFFIDYS